LISISYKTYEIFKTKKEETIMVSKRSITICLLSSIFLIIAWIPGFALNSKFGNAAAQQGAPTESKGVSRTLLTAVDLGAEINGMQGRKLELRMVTIEPGGVAAVHSHKDLPGAAHVLKGTLTEHRGDVAKEYHAGDSFNEVGTHWAENKGKIPVVLIVTIISK
jgi:quercetin dioxygenase-like cupin family protein